MTMATLLVTHAAATWFMTGLIWVIQRVHYPMLSRMVGSHWIEAEQEHRQRIFTVVMPVMLLEGITGLMLLWYFPSDAQRGLLYVSLLLLLGIWGSTFLIQVPLHQRLSSGWDARIHVRLVQSNWIRTVGWTLRAVLVGMLLI